MTIRTVLQTNESPIIETVLIIRTVELDNITVGIVLVVSTVYMIGLFDFPTILF
jgi:hypothetical protein